MVITENPNKTNDSNNIVKSFSSAVTDNPDSLWTTVPPPKKKKNACVKGTLTAHHSLETVKRKSHRKYSGVFVSRLKPNTQAEEIDKHVTEKYNINNTSTEKLATKFNTYSSFVINVHIR